MIVMEGCKKSLVGLRLFRLRIVISIVIIRMISKRLYRNLPEEKRLMVIAAIV